MKLRAGQYQISRLAILASLFGLFLNTAGAVVTARAVIITEKQADALASTLWKSNPTQKQSLLEQSRSAQCGLWLIVAGTIVQVLGTALPLFKRA